MAAQAIMALAVCMAFCFVGFVYGFDAGHRAGFNSGKGLTNGQHVIGTIHRPKLRREQAQADQPGNCG